MSSTEIPMRDPMQIAPPTERPQEPGSQDPSAEGVPDQEAGAGAGGQSGTRPGAGGEDAMRSAVSRMERQILEANEGVARSVVGMVEAVGNSTQASANALHLAIGSVSAAMGSPTAEVAEE